MYFVNQASNLASKQAYPIDFPSSFNLRNYSTQTFNHRLWNEIRSHDALHNLLFHIYILEVTDLWKLLRADTQLILIILVFR